MKQNVIFFFFCEKICSNEKKVVFLHAFSAYVHVRYTCLYAEIMVRSLVLEQIAP